MNTIPTHAEPTTSTFVGVRSTRVFCRPDCRHLRRARPENLVGLAGIAEARAWGFRPCRVCGPGGVATMTELVTYGVGRSDLGPMFAAFTGQGLAALFLLSDDDPAPGLARLPKTLPQGRFERDDAPADEVARRAAAFVLEGQGVEDLPLDGRGTPFQKQVWDALVRIPRGTTSTYAGVAADLGLPPGASRAVGTACGANPIALIVPCHRVLRTGGGLGGYYYGLDVKRRLLELEGALLLATA